MTVWFPCVGQHGAMRKTTGPEPAGGNAAGVGIGEPQIVVGLVPAAG